MATTTTASNAHRIGQLCVGGDWACAHGDIAALRFVARELAISARDPLHRDLLALAETCREDPDLAVEQWSQLKRRLAEAQAAGSGLGGCA